MHCAGVSRGVVREILNHRLCVAHPNIVQFREVFLTPQHLAIVMEFAAGGDMFEYVIKNKGSGPGEGLKEEVARHFFQQLILALDFCQKLGIANRYAQKSAYPTPPASPPFADSACQSWEVSASLLALPAGDGCLNGSQHAAE